ncbi:MAG: hypothetical protein KF745_09170 [Phycisphaeraceae bacterium]|nr:hypothetical protein [Phycisphaeraceae bacterium]
MTTAPHHSSAPIERQTFAPGILPRLRVSWEIGEAGQPGSARLEWTIEPGGAGAHALLRRVVGPHPGEDCEVLARVGPGEVRIVLDAARRLTHVDIPGLLGLTMRTGEHGEVLYARSPLVTKSSPSAGISDHPAARPG